MQESVEVVVPSLGRSAREQVSTCRKHISGGAQNNQTMHLVWMVENITAGISRNKHKHTEGRRIKNETHAEQAEHSKPSRESRVDRELPGVTPPTRRSKFPKCTEIRIDVRGGRGQNVDTLALKLISFHKHFERNTIREPMQRGGVFQCLRWCTCVSAHIQFSTVLRTLLSDRLDVSSTHAHGSGSPRKRFCAPQSRSSRLCVEGVVCHVCSVKVFQVSGVCVGFMCCVVSVCVG